MYNIIMDIDQTLANTMSLEKDRDEDYREWKEVSGNPEELTTYYRDVIDKIHYYGESEHVYVQPFKGMLNFIREQRAEGSEFIFVSSSPKAYCEAVINRLSLGGSKFVGYEDTREHKPSSQPYELALSMFENKSLDLIVIGDEPKDIDAAYKLNIQQRILKIRAMWGQRNRVLFLEDHRKPDLIAESVDEVSHYLTGEWVCKTTVPAYDGNGDSSLPAIKVSYCFDYYPRTGKKDEETVAKYQDVLSDRVCDYLKKNIDSKSPFFDQCIKEICVRFLENFVRDKMESYGLAPENIGLFLIPGSKKEKWSETLANSIIPIVCERLGTQNCVRAVYRKEDKESSHSGGNRSIDSNIATLGIRSEEIRANISLGILIDDVETTGASIFAFLNRVRSSDNPIFPGKFECVVFAKTKDGKRPKVIDNVAPEVFQYKGDMIGGRLSEYFSKLFGKEKYKFLLSRKLGSHLVDEGFLVRQDDAKIPTELGRQRGMVLVEHESRNGKKYHVISYGEQIQRYIFSKIHDLIAEIDEEHGGIYLTKAEKRVTGIFQGARVCFDRTVGTVGNKYVLNDEEVAALLRGEVVIIKMKDKKNPINARLRKIPNSPRCRIELE